MTKKQANADVALTEQPAAITQALLDISHLIGSTRQLDWILQQIVQITAEMMRMPICSVYLVEDDGCLRKRSNVGLRESLTQQATFPLGEGIPGWVAQHGKLVALADVTQDPRHLVISGKNEPHAYIASPLTVDGETIGVLTARVMVAREFSANQCRLFEAVSKLVAMVIHKHRSEKARIEALHLAAVGTSLSEIAHYVKNIMFTTQVAEASINTFVEKNSELARVRDSWRALRRANQKIRKLVGDMLSYCREKRPELEASNINAMVAEVVRDLQDHADKHGVTMVTDLDTGIPVVWLSPLSIYDVLLNLVTNGIDAIPDGAPGLVTVRTRMSDEDENYEVMVADNGTGIPDDVREKIFSLFFSTKGEKGTGIGLAATKKAVERHAGSIRVETALDEGTQFMRIRLPVDPRLGLS